MEINRKIDKAAGQVEAAKYDHTVVFETYPGKPYTTTKTITVDEDGAFRLCCEKYFIKFYDHDWAFVLDPSCIFGDLQLVLEGSKVGDKWTFRHRLSGVEKTGTNPFAVAVELLDAKITDRE